MLVRGNKVSQEDAVAHLVCIPAACCDANEYFAKNIDGQKVGNELLEWASGMNVQCWAKAYPGRSGRSEDDEPGDSVLTIAQLANELTANIKELYVSHSSNKKTPLIIVGHSMGVSIGFELVQRLREIFEDGAPEIEFIGVSGSCLWLPRNWEPEAWLDDEQFKKQCISFGLSEKTANTPHLWEVFGKWMRNDFRRIDRHKIKKPSMLIDFPTLHCTFVHATEDTRITETGMKEWLTVFPATKAELRCIPGPHNIFYDLTHREGIFQLIKEVTLSKLRINMNVYT